jgi:hypothetical protein
VCTPQKVKGKREIQNLECSINYDTKGASNKRGERQISSCLALRALGVFLGLCYFVGFGFEGFRFVGLWLEGLGFLLVLEPLVYAACLFMGVFRF